MPGVKPAARGPDRLAVLRALADPTRLALLGRLDRAAVCVCDLQAHVGRDQPTVSRHLAVLRRAGLVTVRKDGRWCHYRRSRLPAPLARLVRLAAPPIRKAPGSCC